MTRLEDLQGGEGVVPILGGHQRGQPRLDELSIELSEDVRSLWGLQRFAYECVETSS